MSAESRQQRRQRERRETRRQQFDRVHGQILAGCTIRDMWVTYATTRFENTGVDIDSKEVEETVKHAFYSGVAAMYELMMRVSPEEVGEDVGVEMLNRLQEELDTYTRGLK